MNAGKTTIMTCATGLDLLQRSGNFPCAICRTGVAAIRMHALGAQEVHWAQSPLRGHKLQVLYMFNELPHP